MAEKQRDNSLAEIPTLIDEIMAEAEKEMARLQEIERRLISRREEIQQDPCWVGGKEKKREPFATALRLTWLQGQMHVIRMALDNTESEGGAS